MYLWYKAKDGAILWNKGSERDLQKMRQKKEALGQIRLYDTEASFRDASCNPPPRLLMRLFPLIIPVVAIKMRRPETFPKSYYTRTKWHSTNLR